MSQKHHTAFRTTIGILAGVLLWCSPVQAGYGLHYRSASTKRMIPIAGLHRTVPPGLAFAGSTFSASSKGAIASTAACGGASVVAFCGRVSPSVSSASSGIFVYDGTTDTFHDVAMQGAATPIGGTWLGFICTGSSPSSTPAVAIDSGSCTAHVIFPGKATTGVGIFDASFSLPSFSSGGVTTLVQSGVTPAPAPFTGGAVISYAPSALSFVSAAYGAGPGLVVGFGARATIGTTLQGTGIFTWQSGGALTTHARTGDPTCAPPWSGAGPLYSSFGSPIASALTGPAVTFVGRSSGGGSSTDSAVVRNESGCGGTNVVVATEGAVSPVGGTYGDFAAGVRPGGNAIGDSVFLAKITGVLGVIRALIRSDGSVVARDRMPDTQLGATQIRLTGSTGTETATMNDASAVVFAAGTSNMGSSFTFHDTPTDLPAMVTRGLNPQIDNAGNMTIILP